MKRKSVRFSLSLYRTVYRFSTVPAAVEVRESGVGESGVGSRRREERRKEKVWRQRGISAGDFDP